MLNNDKAVPDSALGLLQVTSTQLAAVPGLTEEVRRIGIDRGFDYLADLQVAAMLHRHVTLMDKMNSRVLWGGLLFFPAAVIVWVLFESTDWETSDPVVNLMLFSPAVLLLMVSLYLMVRGFSFRRTWVRPRVRDHVNGYLEVLSVAGLPRREIPGWLSPPNAKKWR